MKTKKEIMNGIESVKSKKVDNNTIEYTTADGSRFIRLHLTDVVTFTPKGTIILNSGGWKTLTTKDRINKYSGLIVRQIKGQWFIGDVLFYDGIEFKNGKLISKEIKNNSAKIDKIKAKIKNYCDLITKNNLPMPHRGDCWYCLLKEVGTGKPLGDLSQNDHLIQHLKDKYLHGSILVNAMKEAGYRDEQIGFHYQMKLADTFKRSVRKYLQKRLIANAI